MRYTDTDVERIIGALRASYSVREAMRHLGMAASQSNINDLFARRGLGLPTDYLLGPPKFTGAAPPELDDDVTAPQELPMVPDRVFVDHKEERVATPAALHRILFVPDTHRPYHDKDAWRLMLRGARAFKPDTVVILGDFADFYAVSSHDKNPSRVASLESEIADVNQGLDDLAELGASRVCYVEGNHEWRLARYLAKNAAALYGMLSVPELLRLEARGIEWTPYMHALRIGHLTITHDVGEAGIYAVKRARDAAEGNIVIGHVHAMGIHYSGSARGVVRVGAAFGWLGHAETAGDYIHAVKKARAWTHGFGIGHMEQDGTVHLQAVPIISGRCVVNGELVQ